MMNLPKIKYWYHATTFNNAESILKDGKIKASMFGTYFANTSDYAEGFVRMRHAGQINQIAVFKIPRSRLPGLELANDHSPAFFPQDLITAVIYSDVDITHEDCGLYEYETELEVAE